MRWASAPWSTDAGSLNVERFGPRSARAPRPRVRGSLATALGDRDHRGDGVRRGRHPGERRGPRLARPDDRELNRPLGRRGDPDDRALLGRVADRRRSSAPRVRRAPSPPRDRAAADDRGRCARGRRRARGARAHRGRSCSRSCSPRPTPRWGRRSSPIPGFRHVSVKGSTSRAGSTTASACRCSWSRSRLPKRRRARSEAARRSVSCSRRSATGALGAWWRDSQPQPWSG